MSLRQTQLSNQRSASQAQVDLLNSLVAMQQARATYDAAVRSVALQKDLLDAEQKKLSLGASVPFNVVQIQRDLAAAQFSQISALANYTSARITIDQAMGTTLERNSVSLAEAQSGKVPRPSSAPVQ